MGLYAAGTGWEKSTGPFDVPTRRAFCDGLSNTLSWRQLGVQSTTSYRVNPLSQISCLSQQKLASSSVRLCWVCTLAQPRYAATPLTVTLQMTYLCVTYQSGNWKGLEWQCLENGEIRPAVNCKTDFFFLINSSATHFLVTASTNQHHYLSRIVCHLQSYFKSAASIRGSDGSEARMSRLESTVASHVGISW